MGTLKSYKLAQKSALAQKDVLLELQALVKSIDRGETMISDLKTEIEAVNIRHQDRGTTQQDIAYLEDLLKCARKKLAWEKQMSGLQKKVPSILETVSAVVNDEKNPPSDEVRQLIARLLQAVETSMRRLDAAKL